VLRGVYESFVDKGVKSDQVLFYFERPSLGEKEEEKVDGSEV
jgi:hypothetical protein